MFAVERGVIGIELHQRIEPLPGHFANVFHPLGGEGQLRRIDVAEADEAERLSPAAAVL